MSVRELGLVSVEDGPLSIGLEDIDVRGLGENGRGPSSIGRQLAGLCTEVSILRELGILLDEGVEET